MNKAMKQFTWKDFERPDGTIKRKRSNEQKAFLAAVVASGWPDIPTWFYCCKNGIPCKTCVVCGAKLNVLSVKDGFGHRGWCSKDCFKKDNAEAYERRASTNIERYGFSTPAKNEAVRERVRESWATKTDDEKQTIVERRSETSLKKYGTKYPSQSDKIKDKIRKTTIERHGGFGLQANREVYEQTMLERYGVTSPLKSEAIRSKHRETCLNRYGVENVSSTKIVRDKVKETMLQSYGIGVQNQQHLNREYRDGVTILEFLNDKKSLEALYFSRGIVGTSMDLGVCQRTVYNYLNKHDIPRRKGPSSLETFFIDNLGEDVVKNDRRLLDGLEIDLYLPEHGIGIECHGEYWHASNSKFPKAPNYHFQKFLLAKSKGIRLFQFWGFEIIETPEDVLETIEKAKNGFKPDVERGFIKIDNMNPFIIDGNLYHLEEPKMTVWNGLELWDAGTSYFLSK